MTSVNVKDIELDTLKAHERTDPERVKVVKSALMSYGIKKPIVIDDVQMIILDGHHRAKAFEEMDKGYIPAILIDYNDDNLVLKWRRPEYDHYDKLDVLYSVKQHVLYPPKTTMFMYNAINGYGERELVKLQDAFKASETLTDH